MGEIKVNIKETKPKIVSVKIQNDQIIVTGSNLDKVTLAKVEGGTNHSFEIESKKSGELILNAKSALSFLVGQTFNLIVSNAQAAATFPITFELQNGQVTAVKLHHMGASSGQVLRFNGTNWAPSSISSSQVFAGAYDASTDTPDIAALGGTAGTYYVVSVAGSQDLGTGTISFDAGDWVIYNGSVWEKLAVGSNTVTSFNGRTGLINPTAGDYSWSMLTKAVGKLTGSKLSEIADVDVTGIQDGDILQWNAGGSNWEVVAVPAPTIAAGSISNTQLANSAVDSNKIVDGTIVNADVSATAAIAQSKIQNLTTDLSNKEPLLPTGGTTAQYLRGNKTLATLDTSVVPENTNLYFTAARLLGTPLTGYTAGTAIPLVATDTIPQALGKLEAYIASLSTSQSNYVLLNGTAAMTGNLQMGNNKITGLATPTANTDAATKAYVDSVAGGGGSSQWTTTGSNIHYTAGNVGINTTTPSAPLNVSNSTGNSILIGDWVGNGVNKHEAIAQAPAYNSATDKVFTLIGGNSFLDRDEVLVGGSTNMGNQAAAQNIIFYTTPTKNTSMGTERMRIDRNGRVGIGTNNPETKLHIDTTSDYLTLTTIGTDAASNPINTKYVMKAIDGKDSSNTPNQRGGIQFKNESTDFSGNAQVGVFSFDGQVGVGVEYPNSDLDVLGITSTNTLLLKGPSSRNISIQPPAGLTGTYVLNLPISAGSNNQVLTTDGAGNLSWTTPAAGGGAPTGAAGGELSGTYPNPTIANGLAATRLAAGTVDNTEFGYLNGVTSNIQTQLDGKEASLPTGGTVAQYFRGNKTLSNFGADVQSTLLTALTGQTALPLSSADTLVQALGKLEAQITANDTAFDNTGHWNKVASDIAYTAGRVGVGVSDPLARLHVDAQALISHASANDVGPDLTLVKIKGTSASPTPPVLLDQLGTIYFGGYKGSGAYSTNAASVQAFAMGTFATASTPSALAFNTTSTGSTNAQTRMVIDNNGNVGIGTASPRQILDVAPAAGNSIIRATSTNATSALQLYRNTGGSYTGPVLWSNGGDLNFGYDSSENAGPTLMTLSTAGNLGIGTLNPATPLHIVQNVSNGDLLTLENTANDGYSSLLFNSNGGAIEGFLQWSNSAAALHPLAMNLGTTGTNPLILSSNGTERMRVTAGGNVGIGTANPQTPLQVEGVISPATNNTYSLGNSTYRFTQVYATNGTINTSDRREKKDIHNSELGLNFINKLRPVSYRWNTGVDNDIHYGLIAQEAEEAIKNLRKDNKTTSIVSYDKASDRYGVRYSELISPVIKAIQELYAKFSGVDRSIASIKEEKAETDARIKKLEAENALLKSYLCQKDPAAPICK